MTEPLKHIVERIKTAASAGTPLRIRGGGTKDFYGQSLQGEILDTTALTGISSYEPSELVVTVKAGTPLADLEAVLAEKNQCLPFEPPHFEKIWGTAAEPIDILPHLPDTNHRRRHGRRRFERPQPRQQWQRQRLCAWASTWSTAKAKSCVLAAR